MYFLPLAQYDELLDLLHGTVQTIEKNDYHSKKHKRLKHFELYQAFYSVIDQLDCELVKVRGHQAANQKDDMDRLFTLVDRASRQALRAEGEQSGH